MKNGKYSGKQLNISYIKYIYFKHDEYHREDGPAVEFESGTKHWYFNGKHHRLDGPAMEYWDGIKYWYYYGKPIKCKSQAEFERIIKLLAFK